MRTHMKALMILAAALTAQGLRAQDAAASHYVLTTNDPYRTGNSATVFRLSGSTLEDSPALEAGGWGLGHGHLGTNLQTVVTVGTEACAFISDPGSDDIAAFNVTNFAQPKKLGNYADPTGSGAWTGTALAARGTALYAGYSASLNIGVWRINADCSLTLVNKASKTPTPLPLDDIAVAPDGKTLVVTYAQPLCGVDSFAVSGTTLIEKGPFDALGGTAGIDITSDSEFALVAEFSGNVTEVEIFPINSNSSLGSSDFYYISEGGADSNSVRLSPDEKRVYVANNVSVQLTTLKFNENAGSGHRLTFDCLTTLNNPDEQLSHANAVATAATTGTGGYIYVVEAGNPGGVALLNVPADGCPTEVAGSPFVNLASAYSSGISAYPPRPF
jgi:6-phosphogluconolactonase (cycloisomerase 2 family)